MPSVRHTSATLGRRTARRASPEEAIQKAIVDYLRKTLPHGWIVFHARNGGKSKGENGRAKAMGTIAGWPDLSILGRFYESEADSVGAPFLCFLEVKAPSGSLSPEQREIHRQLLDIGYRTFVVRSIDDVQKVAWNLNLPVNDIAVKRRFAPAAKSAEAA